MKITFLWVGRTRNPDMARAMEPYLRRLGHHAKVDVKIAPEVRGDSQYSEEHRVRREGAGLLERLPQRGRTIGLDASGEVVTSEEFARLLDSEITSGGGRIHFVLGGPSGLSREIRQRADRLVSLTPLTLPHDMARLLLVEQVYRAFTILQGGPYHR